LQFDQTCRQISCGKPKTPAGLPVLVQMWNVAVARSLTRCEHASRVVVVTQPDCVVVVVGPGSRRSSWRSQKLFHSLRSCTSRQ
jgi:hypothetical protein